MEEPPQLSNNSSAAPPVVTTHVKPVPASSPTPKDLNDRLEAYNDTIQKIVDEERRTGSKLPTYKELDRYQLIEKMGDGAFSVVYKALDLKTGTHVAVKAVFKQDLDASQVCFSRSVCFQRFGTNVLSSNTEAG